MTLCHIFSVLAFLVDFYATHVVSADRTLEASENMASGLIPKALFIGCLCDFTGYIIAYGGSATIL